MSVGAIMAAYERMVRWRACSVAIIRSRRVPGGDLARLQQGRQPEQSQSVTATVLWAEAALWAGKRTSSAGGYLGMDTANSSI